MEENEGTPVGVEKSMKDVLLDEVHAATLSSFSNYGVTLNPQSDLQVSVDQIAIIGFSGDDVRGAVGLAVSPDLLKKTIGLPPEELTQQQLEDWLGELSNQVLGKMKNLLLRYDLVVALATPIVLRGLRIQIAGSNATVSTFFYYSSDHGQVQVWLDARHPPEKMLVEKPQEEELAQEGDLSLFF